MQYLYFTIIIIFVLFLVSLLFFWDLWKKEKEAKRMGIIF